MWLGVYLLKLGRLLLVRVGFGCFRRRFGKVAWLLAGWEAVAERGRHRATFCWVEFKCQRLEIVWPARIVVKLRGRRWSRNEHNEERVGEC